MPSKRAICTATLIPLCSPHQARTPTALALGSFDGLHAGHRTVINEVTKNPPGIPTVVSFWPHPREILYAEPRLRLDLPFEKAELLAPIGVEQLVLVPFDRSLAALKAEDFIETILIQTLKARLIAVGANFRFGHQRKGNTETLKKYASKAGIEILILPILKDTEGRMSSSRIRTALSEGDLKLAKKLMGRPYKFQGQVVQGRGLGRTMGWPTANLQVDGRKFLPGLGVYAAWAWINSNPEPQKAVMNLGPQPTVDPTAPSAVEVHILDQEIDLTKSKVIIEPFQRLRVQERFKDLNALSSQIGQDAEQARSLLRDY